MLADIIVLGLAAGLLIGLVILRGKSGGKYNVQPTDAVIVATFVFLWLFVSGQISKMVIGSGGLTVETADAILSAAKADILDALSRVELGAVDKAGQDADSTIDRVVADRAEALEYQLGSGHHTALAIEKELTVLTQHAFFQYVILTRSDESLFGVFDAHKLVRVLARQPGPYSWQDFADRINKAKLEDLGDLRDIPSFTDGRLAIPPSLNKSDVLKRMQLSHREWLPVVSDDGRFLGVISRSQLTASLILGVNERLSGKK